MDSIAHRRVDDTAGRTTLYAGTKFAQVGLGGSLDRELSGECIRVSADLSGWYGHGVRDRGRSDKGSAELDAYLRPDDVAHAVRVVLEQPRFGAHDRVAAVEHPAAELTTMRGAFSAARPRHRSALSDTDQQSLAIPAAGREVAA